MSAKKEKKKQYRTVSVNLTPEEALYIEEFARFAEMSESDVMGLMLKMYLFEKGWRRDQDGQIKPPDTAG